jgi:hypothetical protein
MTQQGGQQNEASDGQAPQQAATADRQEPRAREGEWDRRHPDFEPGNTVAVKHGAYSERLTSPIALVLKRELLADPGLPDYLRQPQFRSAVDAYCWAEAQCWRLRDYLARLELEEALTDVTESDETEERAGTSVERKSITRRRESVQEMARKYETLASNQRSKLGLDPAAAAKLGRNLAAAKVDIAAVMAQLETEERNERRSA